MSDLHLGEHISRRFNEELEEVRSKVLHMGGVVEEQLANALRVLVNDESNLARDVLEADAIVNSLEVEIDEECTRIVARRQPAATDLRLIMAVSKTITELERMGDYAAGMLVDKFDRIFNADNMAMAVLIAVSHHRRQ